MQIQMQIPSLPLGMWKTVLVPPLTLAVGSGTGTGQAAPGAVPVAAGHLGLSAHFPRASAASCGKDGAFRPVPSSDS